MRRSIVRVARRWRRGLASLAGMLATACGTSQTGPNSLSSAWGALHVYSRDADIRAGTIRSYAISPRDGRLALVGTVGGVANDLNGWAVLAAAPDGRFLFSAGPSRIQSYAVGHTGALSLRTDLAFVPAAANGSGACTGYSLKTGSLSASREHVYLAVGCRSSTSSDTWYSMEVFAVGADGSLAARGGFDLGERHSDSGPFLFAEPGGRIVYRARGCDGLRAESVRPDGTLDGPVADLLLDCGDSFETVGLVRGFMTIGSSSLAVLALDPQRGRLEVRSRLAANYPEELTVRAFGPAGLIIGRYRVSFGQGRTFADEATLYEVGPQGELTPRRLVPDPGHYYSEYSLHVHPSWRFAYGSSTVYGRRSLWALAAAEDGTLSPLQEIPDGAGDLRLLTASLP